MREAASTISRYAIPDYFRNPVIRPYLKNVRDWQGYIRFLGLPDRRENPDVIIDRLFVTPLLTRRYVSPDESPENWTDETETLVGALVENRRLVLLGDPGIGKSTFLNYVAWLLSRPATNALINRQGWRLPLPMVLRELEVRGVRRFDDLLEAFLSHKMSAPLLEDDRSYLMRTLEEGQAFLLLDGIDELGDRETRENLRSAVFEGMSRYPGCHWLMTSRIVGYDEAPFDTAHSREVTRHAGDVMMQVSQELGAHDGGRSDDALLPNEPAGESSRVLLRRGARVRFPAGTESGSGQVATRYIAPFDDRRIEAFARNWYVQREAAASRADSSANHLVRAVHADESILRLARVPNLLTMMALIHRIEATLPHGRALLYERIAEAYLESIDKFRGIDAGPHDLPRKKGWLARVGFEMQRRRMSEGGWGGTTVLMDADTVKGWLSEEMGRSDTFPDTPSADEFLKIVGRRSGLFLPRGEGRYAFVHLSFQEYFAAVAFKREVTRLRWARGDVSRLGFDRDTLAEWAGQSVWRETFSFLFELLASEEDDDWHADLLDCVFGEDFSRLNDANPDQDEDQDERILNLGDLLARLVTNSRSGLTSEGRNLAIACSVRIQLRIAPKLWQNIFGTLLGEDAQWNKRIFEEINRQMQKMNIWALDLSDTGISDIYPLADFTDLQSLNLTMAQISDISPIKNLTKLRSLSLMDTPVYDLTPLSNLSALQSLILPDTKIRNFEAISKLPNLQSLELGNVRGADIGLLAGLQKLQSLILFDPEPLDLVRLSTLPALESLDLVCSEASDIAPLANLGTLRSLSCNEIPFSDLSPLAKLMDLEMLSLRLTSVSDISPLRDCTSLRYLALEHNGRISDLSPLADVVTLQSLTLGTKAALDLTPLANLPALQELVLYATQSLDLSPLTHLASLRRIHLRNVKAWIEEVEDLRDSRPDLLITGEDYGPSDQHHAEEQG